MKLGQRLPAASWQVLSLRTSGAELLPQAQLWLGLVVKKFISTSDWAVESMGFDSARLGHLPSTRPGLPSAQASPILLFLFILYSLYMSLETKQNKTKQMIFQLMK